MGSARRLDVLPMRRAIVVVALVCATLFGFASVGVADEGPTAYIGATLIDGTGAAAIEDAAVVVDDGVVVSVATAAAASIPTGARRVDLAGKWLIPGLIDAKLAQGFTVLVRQPVLAVLRRAQEHELTVLSRPHRSQDHRPGRG